MVRPAAKYKNQSCQSQSDDHGQHEVGGIPRREVRSDREKDHQVQEIDRHRRRKPSVTIQRENDQSCGKRGAGKSNYGMPGGISKQTPPLESEK